MTNNQIVKNAEFIKKMFDQGHKSVFVEVSRNSFNVGFEPFRGSENAWYFSSKEGQTLEQIKAFLEDKQNYVNAQPRSIQKYYRRF